MERALGVAGEGKAGRVSGHFPRKRRKGSVLLAHTSTISNPRSRVHEMFFSANLKKAISPEQSPFHALHSPLNEFSVASRLDVQPHHRFGI